LQWREEVSKSGTAVASCLYHKKIHLSEDGKFRVHSECEPLQRIKSVSWFVLPPVQEYYYKAHHAQYKPLPVYRKDCPNPATTASMDLIYPKWDSKIFIPRQLDGSAGNAVFQMVHRDPASTVYWHLDGQFVGSTTKVHKFPLSPTEGKHLLTLVDTYGETLERPFQVISSR
jgi:penicillin-binding protein 1C